jgi:predicted transcriptional regulator
MSTIELRKRLIEKIQKTDNENLLEEAYRLLELETQDIEVYKLTDDQRKAVDEGRQQIKNGQFMTDDQANKEIDEWLKK